MALHSIAAEGLFRLNPEAGSKIMLLGGQIPVLVVEDVFADPLAIREHALRLPYAAPPYPYPGRLAQPDPADESLKVLLETVRDMVNHDYLPSIPPISENERPISRFSRVVTDFAIIDVHPRELTPVQRAPHIDPVPIFGLFYLNEVNRGGTLFFDHSGAPASAERAGYFTDGDSEYSLVGKIEGRFNRLAVYPGFVPHSGEIGGDWIETGERFSAPRLTQRLMFFP